MDDGTGNVQTKKMVTGSEPKAFSQIGYDDDYDYGYKRKGSKKKYK